MKKRKQIEIQLRGHFGRQLHDKLYWQIYGQLYERIWGHLYGQLYEQIERQTVKDLK